jgi:hypothetical protein
MLIAARIGGVALIMVGFALAALSHPMWHSMSAASDKVIDRLLFSGITCTLLGIIAFLRSIRDLNRRTKRLWLIPALLILVPVFGLLLLRFMYVPPFTVAEGGGKISRGALSIRTPTKSIAPPEAGIVFSTVTFPGQQEQLAFLILFDYGGELATYSSVSPNTAGPVQGGIQSPGGRWAEIIVGFSVNGEPIEGRYYVELDDSLTKVATETLSVGGESYDVSSGRVFLIELAAAIPSCQQVDVTMPPVPVNLETRDDILRAGDVLRSTLAERHPEIEEFLD